MQKIIAIPYPQNKCELHSKLQTITALRQILIFRLSAILMHTFNDSILYDFYHLVYKILKLF